MKLIFLYLFIVTCNAIVVKEPKKNVRAVSKCRQTKPVSKIPEPKPNTEANQYEVIELIDEPDCCQSTFKKEPRQYAEIVEDENSFDDYFDYDVNDGSINNDSSYDGSDSTYDESNDGLVDNNDNTESDNDNYETISDDDGDTNSNQNMDIAGDDNSQNIDESNSSGNDNNNSLNSNNGDNTSSNNNNSGSNNANNDSNDDSNNNSSDKNSSDGSDNNTSDGTSDSSDNESNGNDDEFEFSGKVRAKGRVTIQAHFNGGCDSSTGTDSTIIAYKRKDNDCNQGNQGNGRSSQQNPHKKSYTPYLLLPPVSIPHFFNILNTNCGTIASGSVNNCAANGNGAVSYPCVSGCSSGQGNNLYEYNCLGSTGSGSIGYPLLGYDSNISGLYGYYGSCGSNSNSNSNCYKSGSLPKMNAQGLVTIVGKF